MQPTQTHMPRVGTGNQIRLKLTLQQLHIIHLSKHNCTLNYEYCFWHGAVHRVGPIVVFDYSAYT